MTTITAEMIQAAEGLMGVQYTQAERAQMLDNLEGQIVSAKARRGVTLANSVPMALRFFILVSEATTGPLCIGSFAPH